MIETDWPIWPIFIIQLLTMGLFLLPRNLRILGFSPRTIIIVLLLIIAAAIMLSLYHDSTDALSLHF
jgi:hypothetical protein